MKNARKIIGKEKAINQKDPVFLVNVAKLPLYCDEWSFRYTNRKLADSNRFHKMLERPDGRLKWYFPEENT